MTRLLSFIILFITLGSCVSCVNSINEKLIIKNDNTHQDTIEHVLKSTVTLIDPVEGPYCSGFFISPTKILTARHCVDIQQALMFMDLSEIEKKLVEQAYKSEKYFIVKYNKNNLNEHKTKVDMVKLIYISKEKASKNYVDETDIAILEISEDRANEHYLKINTKPVYPGEGIFITGSPYQISWFLSHGNVARLIYNDTQNYIGFMSNSSIIAGSSGGPVVNQKGECLGMLSSVLDVNAQFSNPQKHVPVGEIGFIVGSNMILEHLNKINNN